VGSSPRDESSPCGKKAVGSAEDEAEDEDEDEDEDEPARRKRPEEARKATVSALDKRPFMRLFMRAVINQCTYSIASAAAAAV
jgi:cobalamin biosynthesis protein CobT